jgi:hypothetical protein
MVAAEVRARTVLDVADATRAAVRVRAPSRGPSQLARSPQFSGRRARAARWRTPRPGPRSGLGLTIARNITHKHGGTLTLRNKPGGGLECLLVLPIQR